jgi:hypothetical protein
MNKKKKPSNLAFPNKLKKDGFKKRFYSVRASC